MQGDHMGHIGTHAVTFVGAAFGTTLFAEAGMDLPIWAQTLINLGGLGILSVVLFYLLNKQTEKFEKQRTEDRKICDAELTRQREMIEELWAMAKGKQNHSQ
jgi:hypothetical protein